MSSEWFKKPEFYIPTIIATISLIFSGLVYSDNHTITILLEKDHMPDVHPFGIATCPLNIDSNHGLYSLQYSFANIGKVAAVMEVTVNSTDFIFSSSNGSSESIARTIPIVYTNVNTDSSLFYFSFGLDVSPKTPPTELSFTVTAYCSNNCVIPYPMLLTCKYKRNELMEVVKSQKFYELIP